MSSNDGTLERGASVLYRRRDVEDLVRSRAAQGHGVQRNLLPGDGPLERLDDVPPSRSDVPLRIRLDPSVATSLGLLIRKAP